MNDTNPMNIPTPTADDLTTALDRAFLVFNDYANALEDKSSSALEDMASAYKQFHETFTELVKMKNTVSKFVSNMHEMFDDLAATVEEFDEAGDILADAMRDSGLIGDEQEDENEEEE